MANDLVSRFSALLAEETHRADRVLDEDLAKLHGNLSSKGRYHGGINISLTKGTYERDVEARFKTLLTLAGRVLAGATPLDSRTAKAGLDAAALAWLGEHISDCQARLREHSARFGVTEPGDLDLGQDRIIEALRAELGLLGTGEAGVPPAPDSFVDPVRLEELRSADKSKLDVSRLVRLCEELNTCYRHSCFHAVAFITRAILDHVPPAFDVRSFGEVASNYSGTKSFRESAAHLEKASRKISDALLHGHIRRNEILPTLAQVDARQQLDVVLGEVVRILREP
jgi:hypothetical protein